MNVGSFLLQVSGKAVSQYMNTNFFSNTLIILCRGKHLLNGAGRISTPGLLRFKQEYPGWGRQVRR